MGAGGYILGGLLQGIGRGQEMTILQARQDALENLRNQRTIEAEGRAETRAIDAEDRAESRQARRDDYLFSQKKELVGAAGEAKIGEIRAKGEEDRRNRSNDFNYDVALAKINNVLDMQRDAKSIELRAKLDKGQAQIEKDSNGELVIIDKTDGSHIRTGIQGEERGATAGELEALGDYRTDLKSAQRNGTPLPKRSDYTGREERKPLNNSSGNSDNGTAWYGGPNMRPARPTVGTVKGGYVYIGGDPAKPESWSKQR